MKPLLIVESGTKIKTISKLLNYEYDVICSYGHFDNLPKNELGIDTNSWIGKYNITNEKAIKNIRKCVKNTDIIYLASDPDMEGEAIAYHIWNNIKDLLKHKVYHRIEFNEITKSALENALNNPRKIDEDIIEAQETRRFVDRLVGYKLSPTLWSKFNDNTLSVGRVQTIALMFCLKRYHELIEKKINSFWTISGFFKNNNVYEFKLYKNTNLVREDWANTIDIISLFNFNIPYNIKTSEKTLTHSPPPSYTTTSLQQDAYNKFKFTSKKTMMVSQQLYENGMITYMRTDSTNISNEFKNKIIKYIEQNFKGKSQFRSHKNKITNAQEAHEAIRITDVNRIQCDLNEDCRKLYGIIWKRTVASQMVASEYTEICTEIKNKENDYVFKYIKSLLSYVGYLIIYDQKIDDIEKYKLDIEQVKIHKYQCQPNIDNLPTLYNEITLIKELEKNGIGRPSTYSSIVQKIFEKKYVEKKTYSGQKMKFKQRTIKKEKVTDEDIVIDTSINRNDLLIPTITGQNIIEFLETKTPFLLDISFTANMEVILDKITKKEFTKKDVLTKFYEDHIQPNSVETKPISVKKSGILKTKYGYCYYNETTNKYTNIESYLKWKKKSVDELQENELKFLKSLPKKLDDNTYLHLGPYGLYKKEHNKNVKIEKKEWDSLICIN
jgi:DNA topoisomerase-1